MLCGLFSGCGKQRVLSSCGEQASHCGGFSYCGAQALGTRTSLVTAQGLSSCGSWALENRLSSVAHGLSCSAACGIFLDQGLNLCPLHWQVDSPPLSHQGKPSGIFITLVSAGLQPCSPIRKPEADKRLIKLFSHWSSTKPSLFRERAEGKQQTK